MKIVFPMTGANRFTDNRYIYPKPLIDIGGRTMIENAISNYEVFPDAEFITIVNQQDVSEYNLDQMIKRATEGLSSSVRVLSGQTEGALCTTLLVSDCFSDEELIISNYDQHLGFDVAEALCFFRNSDADFGVVSFDSVHPKWSYVRLDEIGSVIESAEKKPISRHALAGLYYFRKGSDFTDSAMNTILHAGSDKEQFYLSEAINASILAGLKGACFKIGRDEYHNFYDSSELREFIDNKTSVKKHLITLLTEAYVKAFDAQDLDKLAGMLAEDAILYDPSVGEVKTKKSILEFVAQIFTENDRLNFVAKRVVVDKEQSVIEFLLTLGSTVVKGVDLIAWENGKIKRIDAYLETQ